MPDVKLPKGVQQVRHALRGKVWFPQVQSDLRQELKQLLIADISLSKSVCDVGHGLGVVGPWPNPLRYVAEVLEKVPVKVLDLPHQGNSCHNLWIYGSRLSC